MSSSQPAAKINLPKGMENIMTSRSSRYAVDCPVDPPSYVSRPGDNTDAPYSAENLVPRNSASYNTGNSLIYVLLAC